MKEIFNRLQKSGYLIKGNSIIILDNYEIVDLDELMDYYSDDNNLLLIDFFNICVEYDSTIHCIDYNNLLELIKKSCDIDVYI